ncbi:MAG: acyltransferase, partial [Bacteroidales bacterium]|nr:acyltransferase [Bacteroidales bacterium]
MSSQRMHFPTFDAFRFFSFLLVFLHHSPIPESSCFSFLSKSGGIGVIFFFVLSGFLITYILLDEKIEKGKISLKKFFVRRILRIWPLFYAMLLFAYLTPYILDLFKLSYSNNGYEPNWLMSVLFLENYKMMLTNSFPNVSPLGVMWSLCIEEHFYIVWGILITMLSIKKIPFLITGSIVFANIARLFYAHYNLSTLDLFTNIDYFAYGAIPAYILHFRKDIISKIEQFHYLAKYGVAISSLLFAFILPNIYCYGIEIFMPFACGISFSSTLLFTLPPTNRLFISDKKWVSKLGIYTYGLYLFHTIIINLFHQ